MNPRDPDGAVRYHRRRERRPLPVLLVGAALLATLLWAQLAVRDAGEEPVPRTAAPTGVASTGTAVATGTPTGASAGAVPTTGPTADVESARAPLRVEVGFDAGSDAPAPGTDVLLDEVADAVLADDGLVVRVTGHAEPSNDADLERELSRQRALRVVDLLVARGVPGGRAEVVAAGADEADGRTGEENRRVTLEVVDR